MLIRNNGPNHHRHPRHPTFSLWSLRENKRARFFPNIRLFLRSIFKALSRRLAWSLTPPAPSPTSPPSALRSPSSSSCLTPHAPSPLSLLWSSSSPSHLTPPSHHHRRRHCHYHQQTRDHQLFIPLHSCSFDAIATVAAIKSICSCFVLFFHVDEVDIDW